VTPTWIRLARLQFDHEEGKEWSKEQIGDVQEIAGPDLFGMGVQKRAPLLTSWLVGSNSSPIFLEGALTDMDAQFPQVPTNPFSAPESIVLRHLPDQGAGF